MALPARAVALLALSALLLAQTADQEVVLRTVAYTPPSIVLRAETNLVETDLAVRDGNGHGVPGLHAGDFEVLDNGVPQTIASFSELRTDAKSEAHPAAPKFVTFFFDDLHMGGTRGSDLPFVKQAARNFADKHLKPGDRMSIATTSGRGELDFTDDAKRFAEDSGRLNNHAVPLSSVAEYHQNSVNTLAELTSAALRLAKMPGERILVFLSAGFVIHINAQGVVYDCEPELHQAIDAAVHGSVTIDVVQTSGPKIDDPTRRPLKEISAGTGGHLFENTNDIEGAMQLAADPEVTYQLAFNPSVRDGNFHTLKIQFKTRRKDSLEFRPGYLSRKDGEPASKAQSRGPLDDALFSKDTPQDLSAKVTSTTGPPKDGAIPLTVAITLDIANLKFGDSHGRHTQQIAFLVTLFDTHGAFVTGQQSTMDLALTDERLASLRKGLRVVGTLSAPPGKYEIRAVVREALTGHLAAAATPVELGAQ